MRMRVVLTLAVLAAAPLLRADVVESSPSSLKVKEVLTVAATPEKAWQSFMQIGKWWSGEHTYSGDASNLHLDARAGGCFCETLPGGGGVLHMTIVYFVPNQRMTLTGGLGPLQTAGVAGSLTFQVVARGTGAEIQLLYNVGGFYPGGLNTVGSGVDSVLGMQMQRLQRLIDTGSAEEEKLKIEN